MNWIKSNYKALLVLLFIFGCITLSVIKEDQLEYWKWWITAEREEIEIVNDLNKQIFYGKGRIGKRAIHQDIPIRKFGMDLTIYQTAYIHHLESHNEDLWMAKIRDMYVSCKGKENEDWKIFDDWFIYHEGEWSSIKDERFSKDFRKP